MVCVYEMSGTDAVAGKGAGGTNGGTSGTTGGATSGASVSMDAWMDTKENVQPLREGRDATTLATVASPEAGPRARRRQLAAQRAEYERQLAVEQSKGAAGDVMDVWRRYIHWAQQSFPTDAAASEVLALVARCTRELADSPAAADDKRYLAVWIRYADLRGNDGAADVFRYLEAHAIGQRHAMYYEALSAWHELNGRIPDAKRAYQAGITARAVPLDRLQRHYREFIKRCGRNPHRSAPPAAPAAPLPDDGSGRAALGVLSTASAAAEVGSTRLPARNADGTLCRAGITQINSGINNTNGTKRSEGSVVQIFSENANPDEPLMALAAKRPRSDEDGGSGAGVNAVPTVDDVRKENAMRATEWTTAGFGPKTPSSLLRKRGFEALGRVTPAVRSFQSPWTPRERSTNASVSIFVDKEFDQRRNSLGEPIMYDRAQLDRDGEELQFEEARAIFAEKVAALARQQQENAQENAQENECSPPPATAAAQQPSSIFAQGCGVTTGTGTATATEGMPFTIFTDEDLTHTPATEKPASLPLHIPRSSNNDDKENGACQLPAPSTEEEEQKEEEMQPAEQEAQQSETQEAQQEQPTPSLDKPIPEEILALSPFSEEFKAGVARVRGARDWCDYLQLCFSPARISDLPRECVAARIATTEAAAASVVGTPLSDVLAAHRASGKKIEEVLAVYYATEVLQCLRLCAAAGVVHGALAPTSLVLRYGPDEEEWPAWEPAAAACAHGSTWAARGLTLRGFSAAASVDTTLVRADQCAGRALPPALVEIQLPPRAQLLWAVDALGAAAVLHAVVADGAPLAVVSRDGGRVALARGVRRTWRSHALWTELFDTLLNWADTDPAQPPPFRELGAKFETFLAADPKRAKSLTMLLLRQQIMQNDGSASE